MCHINDTGWLEIKISTKTTGTTKDTDNSFFERVEYSNNQFIPERGVDNINQSLDENTCTYSYCCKTGSDNSGYNATYQALSDGVIDKDANPVTKTCPLTSSSYNCKFEYECKIGKNNITFKSGWQNEICGITKQNYPGCSSASGKTKRFKIKQNAKNANKNKCEYLYECNSYYKIHF